MIGRRVICPIKPAYYIVYYPISELGQCPGNSHTIWVVGQMDIGHVAVKVDYLSSLRELNYW